MRALVQLALLAQVGPGLGFNPGSWDGPIASYREQPTCSELLSKASALAVTEEAFATSGIVGLGGGIEYAFEKSFCPDMQAAMDHQLSCKQLMASVKKGLAMWQDRHPALYFSYVREPTKSELLIKADESGREAIAFVSRDRSKKRFTLTFNTKFCFSPKVLMDSLATMIGYPSRDDSVSFDDELDALEDTPQGRSCKKKVARSSGKFCFEVVLAHEVGYVELHSSARGAAGS